MLLFSEIKLPADPASPNCWGPGLLQSLRISKKTLATQEIALKISPQAFPHQQCPACSRVSESLQILLTWTSGIPLADRTFDSNVFAFVLMFFSYYKKKNSLSAHPISSPFYLQSGSGNYPLPGTQWQKIISSYTYFLFLNYPFLSSFD